MPYEQVKGYSRGVKNCQPVDKRFPWSVTLTCRYGLARHKQAGISKAVRA